MNLVSRYAARVTVRQLPVLLLCITAFFSLPFLAFSLVLIVTGTEADGKIFCLVFGLLMLWVFLEFVATRERIEIETDKRTFARRVSGVFINKHQLIDLRDIKAIGIEVRTRADGYIRRPRQYLYLYGDKDKFLINSPAKVSIDHTKLGKLLSEITLLPYQEQRDNVRNQERHL